MKKINELINYNNLRPTDAIILKKKFIGMADHYALFMGYRNNEPLFIANYRDGVREVSAEDMQKYLQFLEPERIEYFEGNESERAEAINRAFSRLGERAYDYIANNCEHFKNWVHSGEHYSSQVNTAGNVALAAGAGAVIGGLAAKNKTAVAVGIGGLLLGAILKSNSGNK